MSFSELVIKAAVACSTASTAEEIVAAALDAATKLGFEFYTIYEAAANGDRVDLYPILGRGHLAWQAHYSAAGLAASDIRLRRAKLSSRDFFCSEVLRDDPSVSKQERRVFDQAKAYGLNDSFVLPYRTASGRVFSAVFIGRGNILSAELRVQMRTLAHELVLAALRIAAESSSAKMGAAPKLTPRQLQCLAMVRDGRSSQEIAALLQISHRTVDHYVADACTRLGVKSRVGAVAKAVNLELVPAYPST